MFRLRPSEEELLDWLMLIAGAVLILFFKRVEKGLQNYCIQVGNMNFRLSKENVMQ